MRVPKSLQSLQEMGVIDEVLRPLMSGKEAQLYAVVSGGEERVAKIYKDAAQRSFKRKTDYTDGRKVRNSRDARAMRGRSKYGRAQDEEAWRSTEVEMIYRLHNAGVRVPIPHTYVDGVLIMELVKGADGLPAPRLGEVEFAPDDARSVYNKVIQEVVRMLCAGVVHGDLSDFNVLMTPDGPVVIDFPQAVDPANNSNARSLLVRDVNNIHNFLSRHVRHGNAPYAQEMWALFERNELTPESKLRGEFREKRRKADTRGVLDAIGSANRDEERRRQAAGPGRSRRRGPAGPKVEVLVRSAGRTQTVRDAPGKPARPAKPGKASKPARPGKPGKPGNRGTPGNPGHPAAATDAPKKKRRRRRRRRSGNGPATPRSES